MYNMARRCGTCCDCGYHSNRAKRPGKKCGGRSKKARGLRGIEQNMRGAMNAAVTWIGEQVPDAWEHLRCFTPSSRRRFLLNSLENMVLKGGSLEDALPENVLDHIPSQMIERISSLIAIKQETTPEEKELLAAHEVEENTLQTLPEVEEENAKDNLEPLDADDEDEHFDKSQRTLNQENFDQFSRLLKMQIVPSLNLVLARVNYLVGQYEVALSQNQIKAVKLHEL